MRALGNIPMGSRRHPVLSGVALGFTFALLAAAAGCESGTDDDVFERGDGTLQGELVIFVADNFETGVQTKSYGVRSKSGVVRDLEFDKDPGLEAGTIIRVAGLPSTTSERMRVTSLKKLALVEPTVTSALKNGTKYPAKRLAFVIVDIGGGTNITPDNALKEIVGPSNNTDPPLRNYYAEVSYGTEELDGQVFGPFPFDVGSCSNSQTTAMANGLRPMVDQMGGGTFNHYLWYLGSKTSACSWSGLGEVGTPDRPSNDTWYNASASCVVMIQEPGHNFGMQHSSSMDCGSVPFPDVPEGNCTHSEYGDRFDPMGGGCKHMNAWQKTYNGWLQGCNMVRVRSSGTFTLVPIELGCDGAQVLQIPMPKTRMFMRSGGGGSATNDALNFYYLELRTKRGTDNVNPAIPTAVQVRVSGDIRGRKDRGLHTWIIDMDPSTSSFDGMAAGKTFADPAGGVSFTVTELDEDHATVQVTMTANNGGPVCLDGTTPFTAPGPGLESCNAGISTPGGGVGGAGGASGTGGTTGARGGAGGSTGGARGGAGGSTGGSAAGTNGSRGGAGGSTGGSAAGANGSRGGAGGAGGGIAGTNGTAGTGQPGIAGNVGMGDAGNNGTGGIGGDNGNGGSQGSGGATTPVGTGGSAGGGGGPPGGRGVTGGCACDTAAGASASLGATLLLCAGFGLAVVMRRPRRRLTRQPRRQSVRTR
jgi:hypothetical protein